MQLFQQTEEESGHEPSHGATLRNVPRFVSFLQSPGPWRRGHLSQETIYLSSFAGGSEKWQNNVIGGCVHSCDRRQGDSTVLHLFTKIANKICDKHVQLCILFMLQI